MKKVQNKGFTLIELIFVLVILAIVFGVVVATYPGLLNSMKVKSDKSSAKNIANAVRAWYVDYNTDKLLKPELESIISNSNITSETVKISEIDSSLNKYMDILGTKPISLLNANKVKEPNQYFFVGLVDAGLDVRVVISVGIDEGEDISSILADTPSSEIATYDGYEKGIIYIDEPKE